MHEYYLSKLANTQFALRLNWLLAGTYVSVDAVDPGIVASNIGHSIPCWGLWKCFSASSAIKTTDQGAATTTFAATRPLTAAVGGKYLVDCAEQFPGKNAVDDESAANLFKVSFALTGLSRSMLSMPLS